LADRDILTGVNEEGLNKRLFAPVLRSVISGLTALQGFVFSVFLVALDLLFRTSAPQAR